MIAQGVQCCIEALYPLGTRSLSGGLSEDTGDPHPSFQDEDLVSKSHKFRFDGKPHRTIGSQSWRQNRHSSDHDTGTWGHMAHGGV